MSDQRAHSTQPVEGDPAVPSADLANTSVPAVSSLAKGNENAAADVRTTPTSGAGGGGETAQESPDAGSSAHIIGNVLGVVRLGAGAALVVAPAWAGRIWVGPGADGPGSLVFARAIGARDVALGVQILRGVARGESVRHWVIAGFVADGADVAATLIAGRHLTPNRRIAMPLIAAAVGAGGVWSALRGAGN